VTVPLPTGADAGTWPPKELSPAFDRFAAWAAWWSGDPNELTAVYGIGGYPYDSTSRDRIRNHPSQYRGGIVGRFARFFWGEPINFNQRAGKLHIPVAADIARTSAELLFAEPPKITVGGQKDDTDTSGDVATQDRLNELVDDGVHATFIESAEVCAALGGVYLRICWDRDVNPDRPWLSTVHADAAIPEWRWGCLSAVTFWEELANDGREVVRHLERHEVGVILHGVYKGTPTDLGKPVDLTAYPSTADLEPVIVTGIPKLTAEYIPNMKPNRLWRSLPAAAPMGRSDYAGVEPTMDALDEAWSSWMRDLRLGKARIIASHQAIESYGRGQGGRVDLDRELWTGVDMITKEGQAPLTEIQFKIRVEEHSQTVQALTEQVVRGAGYSAQTFGLGGDVAVTATEVEARERSSVTTRGRKISYTRPALASVLETLLMIDRVVFHSQVTPVKPDIEFGDYVGESLNDLAQTAQLLRTAEAASTETLVQMVHPEWDDDRVKEEVRAIEADKSPPVPIGTPHGAVPPNARVPAGPGDVPPGAPGGTPNGQAPAEPMPKG
jgi:hypothetical protein